MDGLYGVMAIDPGGKTGVAWGVFDKEAKDVRETLETRICAGQLTIEEHPRQQITTICRMWRRFYKDCVYSLGIPPSDVDMVIESFAIGPKTPPGTPLASVEIGWGVYGYRLGSSHEHERWNCGDIPPVLVHWQSPANASGFVTDKRLKSWGIWIRGKDHERWAWRHVALRVANRMNFDRGAEARSRARTRVRA